MCVPEEVRHKILHVGQAMNIVPKAKIRWDDPPSIKQDKRKTIVQLTYSYFEKGRQMALGASQGAFPLTKLTQ